jgi:hypothetical protein
MANADARANRSRRRAPRARSARWLMPGSHRGDQMRGSARGAHRVLQVRTAILDGRLYAETPPVAA